MSQINSEKMPTDRQISRFRRFLPQIIATAIKNLILIEMGLIFGVPTIIIPALTGIRNAHNQNEVLRITSEQATWIGMLQFH